VLPDFISRCQRTIGNATPSLVTHPKSDQHPSSQHNYKSCTSPHKTSAKRFVIHASLRQRRWVRGEETLGTMDKLLLLICYSIIEHEHGCSNRGCATQCTCIIIDRAKKHSYIAMASQILVAMLRYFWHRWTFNHKSDQIRNENIYNHRINQ